MNYHALVQILVALEKSKSSQLRCYNCPKTVRRLCAAGILLLLKTHRKRDHVWKRRGPEMGDGKPTNRGYTAFVARGPNFATAVSGISALLAALPAKHDPCDRSYCDP